MDLKISESGVNSSHYVNCIQLHSLSKVIKQREPKENKRERERAKEKETYRNTEAETAELVFCHLHPSES